MTKQEINEQMASIDAELAKLQAKREETYREVLRNAVSVTFGSILDRVFVHTTPKGDQIFMAVRDVLGIKDSGEYVFQTYHITDLNNGSFTVYPVDNMCYADRQDFEKTNKPIDLINPWENPTLKGLRDLSFCRVNP